MASSSPSSHSANDFNFLKQPYQINGDADHKGHASSREWSTQRAKKDGGWASVGDYNLYSSGLGMACCAGDFDHIVYCSCRLDYRGRICVEKWVGMEEFDTSFLTWGSSRDRVDGIEGD